MKRLIGGIYVLMTAISYGDLRIDAVENGRLAIGGAAVGSTCTVDWASSLASNTAWHVLVPVTVTQEHQWVSIPMFYRLRGVPAEPITNHFKWIGMYYTHINTRYEFNVTALTDDLVTNINISCPLGFSFDIKDFEPDGNNRVWDSEDGSTSPHWSKYGDGDYTVTLSYSNGISQSTVVAFMQTNSSPIPEMDIQPQITTPSPLKGAIFTTNTPITFAWTDIDPDANRVVLDRELVPDGDDVAFAIYSDYEVIPDETSRGPLSTRSDGPFFFSPGSWNVDIESFFSVYGCTRDGLIYLVEKKAERGYQFSVTE